MSLHYPASAIVIKCKMRILKYNYSLLIPFTVKNKLHLSFLYRFKTQCLLTKYLFLNKLIKSVCIQKYIDTAGKGDMRYPSEGV